MHEVKLQYLGKKRPFTTPPIFKPQFVFGNDPVWVNGDVAERLMVINPKMFAKLGERNTSNEEIETADSIIPKEELKVPEPDPDWVCEKCGKAYAFRAKGFYDKHVEKCTGSEA